MTLYRDIIKVAFANTWRHKYLWFFGLFAALLGGSGEMELVSRGFRGSPTDGILPGLDGLSQTGIFNLEIFGNIAKLAQEDPLTLFTVLGVLIMIVAVSLFLLWLSISSQAALVHNTARIRLGKKHDFKSGLESGMRFFWPVLGLNVIMKAVVFLAFALLSLPIIASAGQVSLTTTSLLYILSFIIFVPLSVVFSFIIKYAMAYVVIKKEKFFRAIRKGWELFINNWLVSLEMAFVLFFINFLVSLCLILLFLILAVPLLFVLFIFLKMAFYFNIWTLIFIAMLFYLIIILFVFSLLSSFRVASWTGLFIELISRGGVSKLVRLFNRE